MATDQKIEFSMRCPLPSESHDRVVMAHGGGGRMSQRLIESVFLPLFSNDLLNQRHDGAVFRIGDAGIAFSTDSYVVHPLIFPGGTIGDLAVNGTVNDLAMCGAQPLYLSCGFILEEGLLIETLRTVAVAMQVAADRSGVKVVTGDTKVVDRGKADGLFINTAGVGVVKKQVGPGLIESGDAIIVSGDLGAHGITILSAREGLEFEAPLESDTAPLWEPVESLINAQIDIHCMRDLTRGGLTSALNELAQARRLSMRIEERRVPVSDTVRGACEILGLDPLSVANEGRFAAFVPAAQAQKTLDLLRAFDISRRASCIGEVLDEPGAKVYAKSVAGGERILQMLSGEQLPRIC
jgi:hydrogenase expression/formation protein HypE